MYFRIPYPLGAVVPPLTDNPPPFQHDKPIKATRLSMFGYSSLRGVGCNAFYCDEEGRCVGAKAFWLLDSEVKEVPPSQVIEVKKPFFTGIGDIVYFVGFPREGRKRYFLRGAGVVDKVGFLLTKSADGKVHHIDWYLLLVDKHGKAQWVAKDLTSPTPSLASAIAAKLNKQLDSLANGANKNR